MYKSTKHQQFKKPDNLRIIPLGGLGEIGKNMTLFEYKHQILIVDMGFRMPEEDMPGIDYIIPNISYLRGKEKNIMGVIFTHGHLDHIGAIPYFMDKLKNPPIFTSHLTKEIILKRQEDFSNQPKLDITEINDGYIVNLGPFKIEFFRQNHNIPGNFGIFIKTPIGNIVHTSDFKFDRTPINDLPTNFDKLHRISKENVLLLMSDSTGAEESGESLSEKEISQNLEEIFKRANGRIISATFSSLINRVQQIITLSEKYGRYVAVEGYSMKNNIEIAQKLGYLKTKKGIFISSKECKNYPDSKISILCTGAQGEERASLMRIANKEHRFLNIKKGDTMIFSSSVIPGNERTVQILKDELYRQGAIIFHYKMMDIHAGGHAKQEELKKMIEILRPKFFIPVHGQYSMLINHSYLAQKTGINKNNIAIIDNGQVVNISASEIFIEKKTVPSNYIMVDGLGVGDVGEIVLRDRQALAQDGMFVVIVTIDRQKGKVRGSPDIISRGFVYLKESKGLLQETRKKVIEIVDKAAGTGGSVNWVYVKDEMRNKIGQFLFSKTKRRPMILPVVIEV